MCSVVCSVWKCSVWCPQTLPGYGVVELREGLGPGQDGGGRARLEVDPVSQAPGDRINDVEMVETSGSHVVEYLA